MTQKERMSEFVDSAFNAKPLKDGEEVEAIALSEEGVQGATDSPKNGECTNMIEASCKGENNKCKNYNSACGYSKNKEICINDLQPINTTLGSCGSNPADKCPAINGQC